MSDATRDFYDQRDEWEVEFSIKLTKIPLSGGAWGVSISRHNKWPYGGLLGTLGLKANSKSEATKKFRKLADKVEKYLWREYEKK